MLPPLPLKETNRKQNLAQSRVSERFMEVHAHFFKSATTQKLCAQHEYNKHIRGKAVSDCPYVTAVKLLK
jgi:hypothetical protein